MAAAVMALAPGWQTGELDEEWVESSPSPPTTVNALPVVATEALTPQTATSIKAKRGSLRALGHSAPRGLPPSRNGSMAELPAGVEKEGSRILSERFGTGNNNTQERGAVSGRTWSGSAAGPVAGTFVVKDGVEDDRGAHLARNGFAPGKKDMFGPSALEKMFQPPSPPQAAPQEQAQPTPITQAATRRPSHAYAPVNPSRLSKSVTPSNVSGSTSMSVTLEQQNQSMFADEAGHEEGHSGSQHDEPDGEAENDVESDDKVSGSLRDKNGYPFTFTSTYQSAKGRNTDRPIFDPTLSPFANGEPSHSTLHGPSSRSKPPSKPGLQLFRSTYDTYTREHLSAMVDSIAIDPSPSPPGGSLRDDDRAWSSEGSPMAEGDSTGTRSGSSRTRSSDEISDARSSKRMRLSPSSPARKAGGVRDWDAQARAMMDRIRGRDVESTTSASVSQSPEKDDYYDDRDSLQYESHPPTPPLVTAPSRPTHRSNPSTTSSGYLKAAEDLMTRIKARKVSDSSAAPEMSGGSIGGRIASGTSSEWDLAAIAAQSARSKGKGKAFESSRNIFQTVDRPSSATNSSVDKARLETRRPTSSASGENGEVQVNNEDLNRFVSATTAATATTMSTSFVKHPGPRGHVPGGGMRMIKPDDVLGIVPDKVGRMRYDKASMRWVREGLDRVDEAGESRASRSRSEGSEDVFAGLDSWGEGQAQAANPPTNPPVPAQPPVDSDLSDDSESDDGAVPMQAQMTQIIDAESESDSETSMSEEEPLPPPALAHSPPRHVPEDIATAPLTTPTPAAAAPQPIRSALRNPNGQIATPAAVKKRTAWHESVTPAPEGGVPARRSVSFSDGKKTGRIAGLHSEDDIDVGTAAANDGKDEQSDRTRMRIDAMLGAMGKMAIGSDTPSKLPNGALMASTSSTDDDTSTVMPMRSFQSRMAANATFLTECSFGIAHDNLVKLITDVYGAEPWWEHLTTLDLRGKGADSVARLKEFLPDLDDVNLDDNKISYLSGVPAGVRTLHIARNRLTSLTSVDHLRNLQYLDVSGNKLDSVSQLTCLRHLRELKADRNMIRNLDGVLQMDCLIKFSAVGNKIESLDLSKAKWDRLESLNLASNQLTKVDALARLPVIAHLNFEDNDLDELHASWSMKSVLSLRVSGNRLSSLDLSRFPKARTVYADRNRLTSIDRSEGGTSRVENLSLRNQKVPGLRLCLADLESVKRLYISGNPLEEDSLPVSSIYSVIYLEAAGCSLSKWPERFARRFPNVKILNVNYNFLENLDGLRGLDRLRKFTAVGNRLGGGAAKKVAEGLRGLSSLEELDLRSNPSTLGFYLPLILPAPSHPTTALIDPSSSPPPRQAPLPSVTLATIHPASLKNEPAASTDWTVLDREFRRSLPDEWYSKRLVYRGLVMNACTKLRSLDGMRIEEGERRKAEQLLQEVRSRSAEKYL